MLGVFDLDLGASIVVGMANVQWLMDIGDEMDQPG